MRQTIALALIFVGIASLILFTSTDVFTLFARQHTFVNISFAGNDINCVDCHHRIQNELNNSAFHNDLSCEDCHRFTGTGITFASGDGASATPGKEAHAAYTPRCLDCHGGSGTSIGGKFAPPAPAFNESTIPDYTAHKKLVLKAKNSNMSVGENEACLVCHTNYSCEISYSYFYNISYILQNWNFNSFSYNGTRYYDVQWAKSGAKHEFLSLCEIKCTKCHKNIYDALVNGTSNPSNEDYLTHSPIEIDTGEGGGKDWDTDNAWNHTRYHYIPSSNRSQWVNNSYCLKCHNVKKYAEEHPLDASTYDLSSVAGDTNSTKVHCAEALTCATCHGQNKTKKVIDDYVKGGKGHSVNGSYGGFVDNVASNYARTFNSDICMGCHEAAVHPDGQEGSCSRCHGGGEGGGGGGGSKSGGNADVYIESEPSGSAKNN